MADIEQWKEPWHLDKRIPLALIGAILIQTGAAFWWASSINERVSSLEYWRQDSKNVAVDIAVLKSSVVDLKDILKRIESQLSGNEN